MARKQRSNAGLLKMKTITAAYAEAFLTPIQWFRLGLLLWLLSANRQAYCKGLQIDFAALVGSEDAQQVLARTR